MQDGKLFDKRDRAMTFILLDTGVRAQEVCNINLRSESRYNSYNKLYKRPLDDILRINVALYPHSDGIIAL